MELTKLENGSYLIESEHLYELEPGNVIIRVGPHRLILRAGTDGSLYLGCVGPSTNFDHFVKAPNQ